MAFTLWCANHRCAPKLADLKDLGQLRGEGALLFLLPLSGGAAFHRPVAGGTIGSLCRWGSLFRSGSTNRPRRTFDRDSSPFGGLRGIGSENLVFEWGSVEPADDRLHLVG